MPDPHHPTDPVQAESAPAACEPPRHLIVGIGSSAGGMQALTEFFEHVQVPSEMSFMLVMHLSPVHPSHATEILQRSTSMRVMEVTDGLPIERDHVYVIPPGRSLWIEGDRLRLGSDDRQHGRSVVIEQFFRSLADTQKSCAVAIVMSGTGTDGAVGLQRIKEMGGVCFAQSTEQAQHGGMPQAAIDTGMVDFVLPVAAMATRLQRLAKNPPQLALPLEAPAATPTPPAALAREQALAEQALTEIMSLLRTRTKHNFKHYKRPTVLRRLERRMQVTGTTNLRSYRDHLSEHEDETAALLRDMLISVTNFFRDSEAFDVLERDVLPGLQAALEPEQGFRAWVVGCASGEEAYSMAMLLQEISSERDHRTPFQIFASDIDENALRVARQGRYPDAIAADISPSRVRQFCVREGDHLRIAKTLRERMLFANHNVLRDPPFSRVDLICCRNLLIYLDRSAQMAVLETLRFALRPGGVLFLGSSESIDVSEDGFTVIDKRHRLYRRAGGNPPSRLPLPGTDRIVSLTEPTLAAEPVRKPAGAGARLPQHAETHQLAAMRWMPPSVLIDARYKILHLSDGMAPFMQAQSGSPSLNLLDNVLPSLRLDLRTALFRARPVSGDAPLPVVVRSENNSGSPVSITVQALPPQAGHDALLVVFQLTGAPPSLSEASNDAADADDTVRRELESENTRLETQLQEVIEHSEASTEELMSSNEELQAVNEELRSATEELETSREELQSTNEELTTVNVQLAMKVDETSRINDDLQNLINSNDIATVFVDSAMRIKRYTPRALDLFNLIQADVGRLLTDITHRLDYPELVEDADAAFQSLRLVEREVDGIDGRHYMARMQPYRTADDKIEGAILAFIDVTALQRSQTALRASAERLHLAAESTRDFAIITTDDTGIVTSWNRGALRLFGYPETEIIGQSMALLYTEEDRAAEALEVELKAAREVGRAEDERWHRRKDGSVFFASGVTSRLENGLGFAKIARDLTGDKQAVLARERKLSREIAGRRHAEATMEAKEMFLAVMSHELKHPLNLIHVNAELLGRMPEIRAIATAARAARIIQQTVAGQARIIDDLLDLSRARTGKLRLDSEPVDWGALTRRIVEGAQPQADAKQVRLSIDVSGPPPLALFDPVRAEQVVWNLLSNALKFTPEGGSVQVTVTTRGTEVRLMVEDTGRGIASGFIDSVFDMFSQEGFDGDRAQDTVHGERADRDGHEASGLGIGLALVRELVVAEGGRVRASSRGVGHGTELLVCLPLVTGLTRLPEPAQPEVSPLAGQRLLVVDDSVDSVESFGLLLGLTGAEVRTATGGAAALQALDRGPCDVLISDVSMPLMNGLQLIRAVREREDGRSLVAIACSGYNRAQDETEAIQAGFDALIPKPTSLERVERVVAALIQQRRAAAGAMHDPGVAAAGGPADVRSA